MCMRLDSTAMVSCNELHEKLIAVETHEIEVAKHTKSGAWLSAIGSLRQQLVVDNTSLLATQARSELCGLMPKGGTRAPGFLEETRALCTAAIKLLDEKDDLAAQSGHKLYYARAWVGLACAHQLLRRPAALVLCCVGQASWVWS